MANMYLNARAEMTRKNLKLETVAEKMGISPSSLSQKLNCNQAMTVVEAKEFKKIVGTDLPIEVLFEAIEV